MGLNSTHLKHSAVALDLGHQINGDTVRPHEDVREGIIQKAEVIIDKYGKQKTGGHTL
jgi:hypothetical protein